MKTPIPEQEITALKESAMFAEKGRTHFSVRLHVIGGQMTSEQLRAAANLAKRYGDGTVHLTTRQGVEIPHISYEKLLLLRKAIEKSPLEHARSGKCVRGVVACPGTWCKFGSIDTQGLAQTIFKKFGKRKNLPHKFKIAVAGCLHCCSKPQVNDLGVMGVGGGYAILVGGMSGKTPRFGDKLPITIKTQSELLKITKAIIDWYDANGNVKERFGAAIERLGLANMLESLDISP